MPLIGNTNTTQAFTPAIDYFSGNGSTTAFTLSRPIASTAQILIVVANVPQNPSTAYTVNGNTITFTSAPVSGTNNIWVEYTSPITQVIAPSQGTVSPTQIASGYTLWGLNGNDAIYSLGNVGIGTSSPNYGGWGKSFTGLSSTSFGVEIASSRTTADNAIGAIDFIQTSNTSNKEVAQISGTNTGSTSGNTGGYLQFWTKPDGGSIAERMRIDSSGNLLVGTTTLSTSNLNGTAIRLYSGGSYLEVAHNNTATSGQDYAAFRYNGTQIGGITQNGTTGVLYNLTSDYRLKNNQRSLTGAKAFVMALQPKTWEWWDGSGEGVGFIAHEFMEVAKYSGNGEKDATRIEEYEVSPAVPATFDEEGNELTPAVEAVMGEREMPVYQSIQPSSSEVMANLVAFIQEQQAMIVELKSKVEALENK